MANEATEEAVLGTPPGDAAEIVDSVEEAAQEAEASPKTEYIILRIDDEGPVTADNGLPLLEVVNQVDDKGKPVPIASYSNKQAVKTLLGARGWIENTERGAGRFIAVPVRSFVTVERRIEKVTNDIVEMGTF